MSGRFNGFTLLTASALSAPAVSAGEANTMKPVGTVADEAGKPLAGPTDLIKRLQGPASRAGRST